MKQTAEMRRNPRMYQNLMMASAFAATLASG